MLHFSFCQELLASPNHIGMSFYRFDVPSTDAFTFNDQLKETQEIWNTSESISTAQIKTFTRKFKLILEYVVNFCF